MRFRSMKVPTAIQTRYNKAEVRSLVDSGATDNFIHPQFVRRMKLGTIKLDKPKKLKNVDDTTNKSGEITHCVYLNVQTDQRHKEMRFLIADIGQEEVILGYPWLEEYEPKFSWKHGTLDKQYQPVTLTSIHPLEVQARALTTEEKKQIVEELEPRTRGAATDLAIAAKDEKAVVVLPDEYRDFSSVFSEQEAEHFPHHVPGTMRSTLKRMHLTTSIAVSTQ